MDNQPDFQQLQNDLQTVTDQVGLIGNIHVPAIQQAQQNNARLKEIMNGIRGLGTRMERLEGRMGQLEDRFDRLEGRMGRLEGRFDQLEVHLTSS